MSNANRGTASILDSVRRDLASKGGAQAPASEGSVSDIRRKAPSDFWLNIGVTIKGKDGEDVFVSLPVGLALDDMKPQKITGSSQDWIELAQTKNALLEQLQSFAATMEPGQREDLPMLNIQIFRRNEPAQQGEESSNPLIANLFAALGK